MHTRIVQVHYTRVYVVEDLLDIVYYICTYIFINNFSIDRRLVVYEKGIYL